MSLDYWFTVYFCAIQRGYGNPRGYPYLWMAKETSKYSPSLNSALKAIEKFKPVYDKRKTPIHDKKGFFKEGVV